MQGEVTRMRDINDIAKKGLSKPAARAAVHHSPTSEHFRGNFPLFLNRWEEGFELREHDHAYVEIAYVIAGEGYHYVGDRVERAYKGCLYVLPIGTSHVFRPSGASSRSKLLVYNLCIRPEFVTELKDWLSRYGGGAEPLAVFDGEPGSHVALVDRAMELASLFEHMHREFTEERPGNEAAVFGSLLQLAVRIARLSNEESTADRSAAARRGHPNLSNMLDYVHLHFAEPLTVDRLSAAFGMSARHFIRLFRQSTGARFSEYIQRKRMEHACRLLLETDHKIAYIAKCTGYRDAAHFGEVFRKVVGTSPSRYRKGDR